MIGNLKLLSDFCNVFTLLKYVVLQVEIWYNIEKGSDDMSVLKDFDEIYNHAHMCNWGPDWIIVKDIYVKFPDSYLVLTPFAYTYFEELIRSTTSEYGVP